jgi:hypothetical protein
MTRISSVNWIEYVEMGSISMSLLASQNKPTFSKFFLLDLRKKRACSSGGTTAHSHHHSIATDV